MGGIKGTATRYASWVISAIMIGLLGSGCAAKVNREVLLNTKKVAILSVYIDKLGTQPTDDEVMQNTVNYAARVIADALSKRPEWKLAPLNYQNNVHIRDFLKHPASKQQKAGDEGKGFAAALNEINARWEASLSVENVAQRESAHFLSANDMPVVPGNMIWGLRGGNAADKSKVKKQLVTDSDLKGYRKEVLARIGELAGKLDLDGLFVIFLQTSLRRSGESITFGGRQTDMLKMEPEVILVSRGGKVAFDISRPIDDISPSNDGVPIYRIDSKLAVGISFGSARRGVIDLKDPKGKVQKDLYALTDLAVRKFSEKLDRELAKK